MEDHHPELERLLGPTASRSPASGASTCSTSTWTWRHAGSTPIAAYPGCAHLDGCPACDEEHRSLLALVVEDSGPV